MLHISLTNKREKAFSYLGTTGGGKPTQEKARTEIIARLKKGVPANLITQTDTRKTLRHFTGTFKFVRKGAETKEGP